MRQIWAVALTLLREVGRSPGFRLFVPVLLAVALVTPRLASGDNLLEGLQLVGSYGLGLPAFLIALLTLVLATGSLSHELDRGYIQVLGTKPVRPWRILVGKLAGIILLDTGLLLAILLIFVFNLWAAGRGEYPGEQRETARLRFYTSRLGVLPDPPEIDEARVRAIVRRRLEELAAADDRGHGHRHERSEESRRAEEEEMERRVRRHQQVRILRPGEEAELVFRGLPPAGARVEHQVRVRVHVIAPSGEAPEARTVWRAGGRELGSVRLAAASRRVFEIPELAVAEGRTLGLTVRNDEPADSGVSLRIAPESVELLYAYGTFGAGLMRAFLMLVAQYAFLAVLGIFGSAVFSLPTASLLGYFVYVTGMVSGFLKESLEYLQFYDNPFLGFIMRSGGMVLEIVPDFAAENPVGRIVDGRAIAVGEFFGVMARNLCLRSGFVFLAGAWYWSRREMGGIPA